MTQHRRVLKLPVRGAVSAAVFTSRVLVVVVSGHAAQLVAGPVGAFHRRATPR